MDAARLLIEKLDGVLAEARIPTEILLVDDGSSEPVAADEALASSRFLKTFYVLRLRRNLGHQRAIAIALAYIYEHLECSAVVVMDADGEDKPEDVPRLVQAFTRWHGKRIVFAERLRRSESLTFKIFYSLYRILHRALTGLQVKVGNFSIVPYSQLSNLVVVSELWNHYAAAIFKARFPIGLLPTDRGTRLAGDTSMNFIGLVVHGLSAISVFSDIVGVRLLVFSLALSMAAASTFLLALFSPSSASPLASQWILTAGSILLVLFAQATFTICGLAILILSSRNSLNFIPLRDHPFFVERFTKFPGEIDRKDG